MANRILIVEDDVAIADGIAINLQVSGYEFSVFHDGQETYQALKDDHSYDLALLDVMLPGRNGFELMETMQKYDIPVIYLTAKTDATSEILGLKSGAEDYVGKPFEIMTLLVRIEKVLTRTGKLNGVLRFQDITVNTTNRTILKGGHEVSLTPLEFDLLALLLRYKNRSIPREQLLSDVWGTDFYGDTRTIDVHVAHIRKKLDLGEHIKTVAKVGYRLED
ncbi:MAG: response regulator transcription factor [Clostridia bacterium]